MQNYPQTIYDHPPSISEEYRRLWAAVIKQADDDVKGVATWQDKYSVHYKALRAERAIAWFRSDRTDCGSYRWICEDVLKIDPEGLRTRVLMVQNESSLAGKIPKKTMDQRQRALPQL